jgi:uncharacterized protein (DUF362 family)
MTAKRYTKRGFLRASAQGLGGLAAWKVFRSLGLGRTALADSIHSGPSRFAQKALGTVALARNEKLLTDGAYNTDVARDMLNRSLTSLLNMKDPEAAWKTLFRSRDVVGIKPNCLAGRNLSPHPELVKCIIEGLKTAGVREENIIIWERTSRELAAAGFPVNASGAGVRCAGNDVLGFEEEPESSGEIGSCFARVLSTHCTALINVPVLKDHDLAGVCVGMKNMFGGIHNPNKYHDHNCDPYVAHLSAHPYIKDKLRLIVCDAGLAECDGGPSYKPRGAWKFNGLLVGTDPVALDWFGAKIIEDRRRETGLRPLKAVGREPKWLATAAGLRLGIEDPPKTKIIEV